MENYNVKMSFVGAASFLALSLSLAPKPL